MKKILKESNIKVSNYKIKILKQFSDFQNPDFSLHYLQYLIVFTGCTSGVSSPRS